MAFVSRQEALTHSPFPGVEGRVVHGDAMTFAFWDLPAGTLVPEHAHEQEQILHVVHGVLDVTVSGETQRVGTGGSAVIPSNASHTVRTLEDSHVIDVFHPTRPEYGRTPAQASSD